MLSRIKPVFQWRGDHLFCGELCMASFCENGKGGFEVVHAEFQRALAVEISAEKMNRFFQAEKSYHTCQKKIQDFYSEILCMLDIEIMDGRIHFKYWWPNVEDFMSGKVDSIRLGCGGIYLGNLKSRNLKKADVNDNLCVFTPNSFSWQMAKHMKLTPLETICFPHVDKISSLQEAIKIVDPVLKSLEFSF